MIGLPRSTARYTRRPDRDEPVIVLLAELAERFPDRGFGKLFQLIRRRGHVWNHKRVWRVYCQMKLNRRRRGKKRLPNRHPHPLVPGEQVNTSWSIDFMSDALWDGRRFRTFNVLDDFSREALAVEIDLNLPSARVIRTLERIAAWRGYPSRLRLDNVLTVESSSDTWVQAGEAVRNVLCAPHPLPPEGARGLPRSIRSPDLIIINTRSGTRPRPRPYLKQHGVPWKARTLSTGS